MSVLDGLKFMFQGGRCIDNFVVKGTAAGAGKGSFSTGETEHRITCPSGFQWLLFGGVVRRDVSATLDIKLFNSSDEEIGYFFYGAAATGPNGWSPPVEAATAGIGIIMKAGDYLKIVFGANQAALASISAIVMEVPV